MIYRGYLINIIFTYTNGKSDFEVFPAGGDEQGFAFSSTTLEEIKNWIDERTN